MSARPSGLSPEKAPLKGVPDLSVIFAGLNLKNPVIAASGTFGYGVEFADIVTLDRLGGFVVKGLSRESLDMPAKTTRPPFAFSMKARASPPMS